MDEQAKVLVQENNHEVHQLSASMDKLKAVQFGIEKLMNDVDNGIYKKFYTHPGMAQLFINEIGDKLRLIDMAFYHLNLEIQSEVKKIEDTSSELFQKIIKEVE